MEKKIKITTSKQIATIIELMKKNPEIGQGKLCFGSSRVLVAKKWKMFAKELNLLGPPTRSGDEWRRVWINYKANLRRKMSNQQNDKASGGGSSKELKLSEREETVAEFFLLDKQVNRSDHTHGIGSAPASTTAENCDENSMILELKAENIVDDIFDEDLLPSSSPSIPRFTPVEITMAQSPAPHISSTAAPSSSCLRQRNRALNRDVNFDRALEADDRTDENDIYLSFSKTIALQLKQLSPIEASATMSEIQQLVSQKFINSMLRSQAEYSNSNTNF